MSRRGKPTETENRLVVDEGWGEWRRLVGREVIAKTYMILFVVMKIIAWLPKPFDYFLES